MAEKIVTKLTADFFKTISHPVRLNILRILKDGESCVCSMTDELKIEQSNLSQHLGLLKKQGLIDSRKDGQKMMYSIACPSVLEVVIAAEKTLIEQIKHITGNAKVS